MLWNNWWIWSIDVFMQNMRNNKNKHSAGYHVVIATLLFVLFCFLSKDAWDEMVNINVKCLLDGVLDGYHISEMRLPPASPSPAASVRINYAEVTEEEKGSYTVTFYPFDCGNNFQLPQLMNSEVGVDQTHIIRGVMANYYPWFLNSDIRISRCIRILGLFIKYCYLPTTIPKHKRSAATYHCNIGWATLVPSGHCTSACHLRQ